ncbi:hypothetical protein [Sphingobium sp. MI1205]|uniref:hypothetical protein n=1 Tax=Sphingobium sp. MI1205 TaxID=407020 RepID=UPI00076FF9D2|nr:hypothetical protein [Sphingobium sp. MI1205]AMK18932.1 hypothetical protein K663_12760 [Sphingobium sp. MI1205]
MTEELNGFTHESEGQEWARKPLPVELSIDPGNNRLRGWAAPSLAERADDPLSISLMLGPVCLGAIRRDVPRPDVEQHLGFLGPAVGFDFDDFGLRLFACLSRIDDICLSTAGPTVEAATHSLPPFEIGAMKTLTPLGLLKKSIGGIRLVDVWFESHRNLSFRFDGAGHTDGTIDFYQLAYSPTRSLIKVGSDLPLAGSKIVTARLLNPFCPVLMVIKDSSGGIRAIDTLPFPSLVRNGWHAAERMLAGYGGDELGDAAELSRSYLAALAGRLIDPQNHVGKIMIDAAAYTGLERAIHEDLTNWLRCFLHAKVIREGEKSEYILDESEARSCVDDDPQDSHILYLPADAIPTIAVMVNALPQGLEDQKVFGSMGVVEWQRHGRIWSVSFPALDGSLEALQPYGFQQPFPRLQLCSCEPVVSGSKLIPSWPLAVILREKPPRISNESAMEMAADIPRLFETDYFTDTEELSVLILFDPVEVSPVPLLESLIRQGMGTLDITICHPADADESTLRDALNNLLPGQPHQIVPVPSNSSHVDQIIAARDHIAYDEVFIANASTILPDHRTLNALLTLLRHAGVATAGCLVREISAARSPISAGYSLVGLDLRATPALSFDRIDPIALRQPATFPVLANSLVALMTRRATLALLDRHDGSSLRPELDDLSLGLEAIEAGGINLCTTAVAVYADIAQPRHRQAAITLPYRLSLQTLSRIADMTTIIQKIR